MKFFQKAPDGGENSGVTGYFLCEFKPLFSIVLLKFNKGTREAYHSHAFNAVTIWLSGKIIEHLKSGGKRYFRAGMWKYTSRDTFHKVEALEPTWAFSFRGPWKDTWSEFVNNKLVTLTHGRKLIR